jgi:hypothetical protein
MVIGLVTLVALLGGAPLATAQETTAQSALQAAQEEAEEATLPAEGGAAEVDGSQPRGDIIVARTLAELPEVVRPGETVYVTDASGVREKYKMQGVSTDASSVLLERNGAILELQEDQVLNMAVRRSDRLWDGAVKGALIGASPMLVTAIVCAAVDSCGTEALAASLYFGLVGAGIGVGVDAAFRETHVVYSAAPPVERPKIAIAPMISGQKKGAMVRITF